MKLYSCMVVTHDNIYEINNYEITKCHNLLVLCSTNLQEMGFENSPSDHDA